MKITFLTKAPGSIIEPIYFTIKKVLFPGIDRRGPFAVQNSLLKGLDLLKVDYRFNPPKKDISEIVCVLAGVRPLKWAIKNKQKGNIKKIIAGPNIVVTPEEANGILLNDMIDIVITPSEWVKDFYSSFKKDFNKKIKIWAAGVDTDYFKPNENMSKNIGFLVYVKSKNNKLLTFILPELIKRGITYSILYYGKYERNHYLDMLRKSRYMIYLNESESQGIALHEAWSCDVPTLVWDRGFFQYKKYEWHGKTNAPYLIEDCGIRFRGESDFSSKLSEFLEKTNNYEPRRHALENFSLIKSAQNYMALLKVKE